MRFRLTILTELQEFNWLMGNLSTDGLGWWVLGCEPLVLHQSKLPIGGKLSQQMTILLLVAPFTKYRGPPQVEVTYTFLVVFAYFESEDSTNKA